MAQDPVTRAAVDERLEEAELRRQFEAEQAAEQQRRAWRIARGQATAEDLAAQSTAGTGPPVREAWMTDLPPERSAARVPVRRLAFVWVCVLMRAGTQNAVQSERGQLCRASVRCL